MAQGFRRRRIDAQIFAGQFKNTAVIKTDFKNAGNLMQFYFYRLGITGFSD
jgi:hypothetical protein